MISHVLEYGFVRDNNRGRERGEFFKTHSWFGFEGNRYDCGSIHLCMGGRAESVLEKRYADGLGYRGIPCVGK